MIRLWREGYLVSGMEGIPEKAKHCGDFDVATIPEAVELYKQTWPEKDHRYFNADNTSCYGCRFFDNETDARKAFG